MSLVSDETSRLVNINHKNKDVSFKTKSYFSFLFRFFLFLKYMFINRLLIKIIKWHHKVNCFII